MFKDILGYTLILISYIWAIAFGAIQKDDKRSLGAAWFAILFMVLFAALGERLTRM